MFLWSSQRPLPTRVWPVLRLTCLQKTRWLPALTGPTCRPVHKHGETASKSLALRTKVLNFLNVPTLEPIMMPQTNFVAMSSLLYTWVTWTNPYCRNSHLKLKKESVLPKWHSCFLQGRAEWMTAYAISMLLTKALNALTTLKYFRVCFWYICKNNAF